MTDPLLALVGLGIAFLGLEAADVLGNRVGNRTGAALPDDGTGVLRSDLTKWVVAAGLVAFVLLVEGRSPASIRVEATAPVAFAGWVAGGFAFTYGLSAAAYVAFDRAGLETPDGFVEDQLRRPVAARGFTALTAGVTESVLYQGYPIERLATHLGSLPLAGAVSLVAFVAVHYTGDAFSLQETAFIGVPAFCVTVLYVVSGNLLVVVVVHAAVDGVSLLAPELGADPDATGDEPGPREA